MQLLWFLFQVNLEYLARVVFNMEKFLYPDSVVGTDSHTTMINGLGIVGWGETFFLEYALCFSFFLTKLERERREKVVLSTFKLLPQTLSFCLFLNPLHPNVSMHILHTVLYKFPWVLTRRICSTILSFFWWLFPLFSRPLWVIWECYCKEK